MNIPGRTALVTGGARRVGREIALHLARAGADIVLHYHRSAAAASAVAGEIRALGRRCDLVRANLADAQAVESLAAALPPVDILVNCASVFSRTDFATLTAAAWDEVMAVNLRAPFLLSRVLGPAMVRRGSGKIIQVSDAAVRRPYRNYAAYLVSKAALEALTSVLALELAPAVQVNTVAPGTVLWNDDHSQELKDLIVRKTPLGRIGSPADVARTVVFLAEHGDFVTGSTYAVDGGVGIPG